MKISLKIEMPNEVKHKHRDLCEKVKDYMYACDSDQDSSYHWEYLVTLYDKLIDRNNLPQEYKEMMRGLSRFINEHAEYASDRMMPKNLTAENMFKYSNQEDGSDSE